MLLRSALMLCILCFPLIVFSIGDFKPTSEELNLLPEYCKPRATGWGDDIKDPRVKRWYTIFGEDWRHMHHYCKGLYHINQGNRPIDKKMFHFHSAIRELSYSLRRAEPRGKKSILLPLLYTKIGDAYVGLGDKVKAETYYRKSIVKVPQHSSAYKRLVTLLIRSSRYKEAKIINDQGLQLFKKNKFFRRKEPSIEKALKIE
jgi:tetratricopeptide (TPR) repeat protein